VGIKKLEDELGAALSERSASEVTLTAVEESNHAAVAEIDEQIAESREHAARFQAMLDLAAKRFAALARVEERHANHYREALAKVSA